MRHPRLLAHPAERRQRDLARMLPEHRGNRRALDAPGPFYIFTAFVFAYGAETLNLDRNFLLTGVLAAASLSFVSVPLFGHLSDRLGRKRVRMAGALVTGAYGFLYFVLLDTREPWLVFMALPNAFRRGCATAAPRLATSCRR
jgi:MFS family permease